MYGFAISLCSNVPRTRVSCHLFICPVHHILLHIAGGSPSGESAFYQFSSPPSHTHTHTHPPPPTPARTNTRTRARGRTLYRHTLGWVLLERWRDAPGCGASQVAAAEGQGVKSQGRSGEGAGGGCESGPGGREGATEGSGFGSSSRGSPDPGTRIPSHPCREPQGRCGLVAEGRRSPALCSSCPSERKDTEAGMYRDEDYVTQRT